MDPQTVHARLDEVQVVDVREPHEWAAGHVEGARNIPLAELGSRLGELDRDRPVVTVCGGGGRATRGAEQLTSAGLPAEVMEGGMRRWQAEQLPVASEETPPPPATA